MMAQAIHVIPFPCFLCIWCRVQRTKGPKRPAIPPRYSSKASFAGGMGMDDDEGPEFWGWVVTLNLVQLCAASCEVVESKHSGFGWDADEEHQEDENNDNITQNDGLHI